jgi:HTH-type transcriptional regulator, competence development regulator
MEFGQILRNLRTRSGIGIKRLAPELEVNYTYLSKLENNEISPSADLVDRVADYFNYDRDALLLSAGKVPEEIINILREHPDEALKFLRDRFGGKHGNRSRP